MLPLVLFFFLLLSFSSETRMATQTNSDLQVVNQNLISLKHSKQQTDKFARTQKDARPR